MGVVSEVVLFLRKSLYFEKIVCSYKKMFLFSILLLFFEIKFEILKHCSQKVWTFKSMFTNFESVWVSKMFTLSKRNSHTNLFKKNLLGIAMLSLCVGSAHAF